MNKSNGELLEEAKANLRQVLENWSEDKVIEYGSTMSFDELVSEIEAIKLL